MPDLLRGLSEEQQVNLRFVLYERSLPKESKAKPRKPRPKGRPKADPLGGYVDAGYARAEYDRLARIYGGPSAVARAVCEQQGGDPDWFRSTLYSVRDSQRVQIRTLQKLRATV